MPRHFNHVVWDDFLPQALHHKLLQHILDNSGSFAPSGISTIGPERLDMSFRNSWTCSLGLGELELPFRREIKARHAEMRDELGIAAFDISGLEVELVAHRDGCFYRRHVDTVTQSIRDRHNSDRILTSVYYLHALPKSFFGGELALFPLGPGEPVLIEPSDNRLVAFPSFAPHAVLKTSCPTNDFSHARFAVNCWFHQAKVTVN